MSDEDYQRHRGDDPRGQDVPRLERPQLIVDPQLGPSCVCETIEHLAHVAPAEPIVEDEARRDDVEDRVGEPIAHRPDRRFESHEAHLTHERRELGPHHCRPAASQSNERVGHREASADRIA